MRVAIPFGFARCETSLMPATATVFWDRVCWRFGDDDDGAGSAGYARSKDVIFWEKPMLGLVLDEGACGRSGEALVWNDAGLRR